MGWKICYWNIIFSFSLFAQNSLNRHQINIFPFNGNVGQLCFEETTGGNTICIKAPTSIPSDVTMALPDSSDTGKCLGWVSSSALGNLSCSGGSGITLLGGQSGSAQTFSKVDDTNVTLTISSATDNHQFAISWAGTLSKARQNANTVYNDQTNTYTGGNQDFALASLKVPFGAGLEPTTEGYLAYNATNGKLNLGRGSGINNGLIQGPDVSSTGWVPVWNDPLGRELGAGYQATSTSISDTIVKRDSLTGALVNDAGSQVYNIKAYGAVGDGVADDTTEIALAISTCENSARGGTIYIPQGIFGISGGLWHGNGASVGGASTKAVCKFLGAGAGDDPIGTGSANVDVAVIKWIGSNPGSPTYMLTLDGPMFGAGAQGFKLNANSNSNVLGLDVRQLSFSHFKDLSISQTGAGFAMKIWAQKSFDHYACFNTLDNVRIRPATNSVGSALWVGGNSTYGNACSIRLIGGYYNRDNNYTSGTNTATYGVLLDSSDNFQAYGVHFSHTGGNGARNGCTIGAAVGAFSGAGAGVYPDAAHFYGISSGGMCGTTGSSTRPFVVMGSECGAEGQGSCDYHNAFTGGGQRPIALSGESDQTFKGAKSIIVRNGDGAGALYHQVLSTTGTELYSMKRGGVTGAGIEINAYNEIQFKNPSFTEGYFKIRTSTSSSPGTCNSTNEGWIWVKAASSGVATTLTMCSANSAGTFGWNTVQTF